MTNHVKQLWDSGRVWTAPLVVRHFKALPCIIVVYHLFAMYTPFYFFFFAISYLLPASSNPSANICHFLIMPFLCSCTFCCPEHVALPTCGGRISSISLFMKPLTCIHKVSQLQERSKAVASLSLSGGQDKNISSFFPHIPVVSLIFPSNILKFCPHFGLSGGPWLHHWKEVGKCDLWEAHSRIKLTIIKQNFWKYMLISNIYWSKKMIQQTDHEEEYFVCVCGGVWKVQSSLHWVLQHSYYVCLSKELPKMHHNLVSSEFTKR